MLMATTVIVMVGHDNDDGVGGGATGDDGNSINDNDCVAAMAMSGGDGDGASDTDCGDNKQ